MDIKGIGRKGNPSVLQEVQVMNSHITPPFHRQRGQPGFVGLLGVLLVVASVLGCQTAAPDSVRHPTVYPPPAFYPALASVTVPSPQSSPYPPPATPASSPTKPSSPSPTPLPTWPVQVPPLVTPTPLPHTLTAKNVLPQGAQLLAELVAPVAPGGKLAAVLLFHWPIFLITGENGESATNLHLRLVPLDGRPYTPTSSSKSASTVRVRRLDINNDGQDEVVIEPRSDPELVFRRAGPEGWLRLLSAHPLVFSGGALASPNDNRVGFENLAPVLFYAGPKQATLTDVDGDGVWEVDIAYSREDGAATWQVDRYRWDGSAYVYTTTLAQPAREPVPPSLYSRWVEQLMPLYKFPVWGKARLPVQRVLILAYEVRHVDINEDGDREWLLAYLAYPVYGSPDADRSPNGKVGLAVFDATGRLRWSSAGLDVYDLFTDGWLARVEMGLALNRETKGALEIAHTVLTIFEGSGAYTTAGTVVYRAEGDQLQPVWSSPVATSGQMGAGESGRDGYTLWPEDVDQDGKSEWLVSRVTGRLSLSSPNPVTWVNYSVFWPGAVAYAWSDTSYRPAFFTDGERRVPIRPSEAIFLVPRLPQPVRVDGLTDEWRQLEYGGKEPAIIWPLGVTSPLVPQLGWFEGWLYAHLSVPSTGGKLFVAVDADLEADFSRAALDKDDTVLVVHLPPDPTCRARGKAAVFHPNWQTAEEVQVGVTPLETLGNELCRVELGIPLALFGLADEPTPSDGGYVLGGPLPSDRRTYFLRAGQVVGGAVWSTSPGEGRADGKPFDESDPRTWGTWIFVRH